MIHGCGSSRRHHKWSFPAVVDGLCPLWETGGMAKKLTKAEIARLAAESLGVTLPAPQAFHHFTLAHQVDQLVSAREADPDLGFIVRMMALCSLPRTNPGGRLQYKRVNGPYKLIMIAGGDNKLPYGNLPRLLLAWVCTEAVRTQRRDLVLGRSLSEFMRQLGLKTSGGSSRGNRTRLRNQMNRLFHCQIELTHEHEHGERFIASRIADRGGVLVESEASRRPRVVGQQDSLR